MSEDLTDIEEAVVAVMKGWAGLTALCGARFFHVKLPDGSLLPAVTYQLIADVSVHAHGGPSGLARARIQFDAWAATAHDVAAVASELKLALIGVRGTYAGVVLQGAFKVGERSDFAADIKARRRILDLVFWHSEARREEVA